VPPTRRRRASGPLATVRRPVPTALAPARVPERATPHTTCGDPDAGAPRPRGRGRHRGGGAAASTQQTPPPAAPGGLAAAPQRTALCGARTCLHACSAQSPPPTAPDGLAAAPQRTALSAFVAVLAIGRAWPHARCGTPDVGAPRPRGRGYYRGSGPAPQRLAPAPFAASQPHSRCGTPVAGAPRPRGRGGYRGSGPDAAAQ